MARGCHVHGIVRYRTHWGNLVGMLNGSVTLHKGDITDGGFVRHYFLLDDMYVGAGILRESFDSVQCGSHFLSSSNCASSQVRRIIETVKPDFIFHLAAQSLNGKI